MKLFSLTAAGVVVAAAAQTPTMAPSNAPTNWPTQSPTTLMSSVSAQAAGIVLGIKAAVGDCRGTAGDAQPWGMSYFAGPSGVLPWFGTFPGEFASCAYTEYATVTDSAGCIIGALGALPEIELDLDSMTLPIPDPEAPEFLPWVIGILDPILTDTDARAAFGTLINSLATDFVPETLDTLFCNDIIDEGNFTTYYDAYAMAVGQGGVLVPPAPVIPLTRAVPADCTNLTSPVPIVDELSIIGQIEGMLDGLDNNMTEAEQNAAIGEAISLCAQGLFPTPPPAPLGQPVELFLMGHIAAYLEDVTAIINAIADPALKLNEVLALVLFPYQGELCGLAGGVAASGATTCLTGEAPYAGTADIISLINEFIFPGRFPILSEETDCNKMLAKLPQVIIPANGFALAAQQNPALSAVFAAVQTLDVAGLVDMVLSVIPAAAVTCTTEITQPPVASPTTEAPASSATTAAVSAAAATFAAALLF